MTRRVIRSAFIKSLPIMAGYIVLGMGFGILLSNHGYGVLWSFAMGLFIYAGSMQYAGVTLLASGASLTTAAIMTVMINARHLFYSISMIDQYKNAGKYKPYMIFALTDETYSLLSDGYCPDGENIHQFRFLVSLFNQIYWVFGCVAGSLVGSVLPFSTEGIDFSMTALFIASFTGQWISTRQHLPALIGLFSSLFCLVLFGPERFLIPSMLVITLILSLLRKKLTQETIKEEAADDIKVKNIEADPMEMNKHVELSEAGKEN